MTRTSVSQAKNTVRRALRAIVDREPSEQEKSRLWKFFESSCAYCGRALNRVDRKGHIDHLIHDGPNHISNRVLSCPTCNGDEKRDRDWLVFLKEKVSNAALFKKRKKKIKVWVTSNKTAAPVQHKSGLLAREIARVMASVDRAAGKLKSHLP